jgi:hypothetical protein
VSEIANNGAQDKGAPHGSPQAVFEFIEELAHMAGLQAQLIQLHASTDDIAGVEYATRRLWAYMRTIGGTIKDFKEHGQTLVPEGENL